VEPFPPQKPRSGGRRVATAIGIGCGGVFLLALLLVGGCTYWALTPGHQESTFHIVGPESPGFAHLKGLAESSAARSILSKYAAEMQRISRSVEPSELPEEMQWLEAFRDQQGDPSQLLDMAAPDEATVSIEHDPVSGGSVFIGAVNFPYFTRPADLLLSQFSQSEGFRQLEYRDHVVYGVEVGLPVMLSFRGGTLVVGSTREDLFTGLDRLDEAAGREALERRGTFLSADETGDLYGVLPGRDVAELLFGDVLPDPDALEEVRFGLQIDSPDAIQGRLRLSCADPLAASQVSRLVRQLAAIWARELEARGLQLDPEIRLDSSQVLVDLSISGIQAAIELYADRVIAGPGG